jgi:apolipoprotein N-acyltransferase
MGVNQDRWRRLTRAAGAVVLSALALWFGTGLHPLWWLTGLAPLPVLLFAHRSGARAAAAVAFAAWLLGSLNVWTFYHGVLGIPVFVVAPFLIIPAAVFMLGVLLSRALLRRGLPATAALALPAAWVSFEYLVSVAAPDGTAGNLAYSQMDCLPLLQLASLTGIWGVSFVVLFAPAALAVVLSPGPARGTLVGLAVGSVVLLALVFFFGVWRLQRPPAGAEVVTVGLVATDDPDRIFHPSREAALETLGLYARQIDHLARQGARVVVLPEKIVAVASEAGSAKVEEPFRAAAARNRVTVVVGLARGEEPQAGNLALVFSPEGKLRATYQKHHLVPRFEDGFRAGTGRTVLRESSAPWGVEICKDLDFPPLSRGYGGDGVGLVLVPAWDFRRDGWLHGRMAVLRGVEGGFSVARAANQGLLTLSDSRGRVVAEQRSDAAPFAMLVADVAVAHDDTPYVRLGDWFAWLNLVLLAGAVAGLVFGRRAPTAPPAF